MSTCETARVSIELALRINNLLLLLPAFFSHICFAVPGLLFCMIQLIILLFSQFAPPTPVIRIGLFYLQ